MSAIYVGFAQMCVNFNAFNCIVDRYISTMALYTSEIIMFWSFKRFCKDLFQPSVFGNMLSKFTNGLWSELIKMYYYIVAGILW